ncbi:unnamed protein product [Orchesella dallaii]|uniref:Uncharacterized protein n=1 Tax=Orchesella dallaii TaxID=48710 RepID=A0ABP1S3P0_9HEXA
MEQKHRYRNRSYSGESGHADVEFSDANTLELPDNSSSRLQSTNRMELMNKLYDVCHQLKSDGHETGIELPQIVVCGSQSSGKTSVLESLSKEELLPKGDNIQTRSPIQLQLIHSTVCEKYVEFLHLPDQRFTDMNDVRQEIQKCNQVIKDSKKVISEEAITLKLTSPEVVDLTLIDLPGIVAEPNDDQPMDLSQRIEEVVLKYLAPKNSIILVVAAATSDLETNTSLSLAKRVDPSKSRTVVVLTKLDLAQGSNAYDALLGKKRKYELGIFGVVNRSSAMKDATDEEVLEKEKQILRKNFPLVAARNGIPYLTERISNLLLNKVSQTLPNVKGLVEEQINHLLEHLRSLGTEEEADKKKERFIDYLTYFQNVYRGQIDGRKRNLNTDTYPASAHINEIFQDKFYPQFDKLLAAEDLSDRVIDIAICNSQGLQGIREFLDVTDAFQHLIKEEMKKLKSLVIKCAKLVDAQLRLAIATSHSAEANRRYHNLRNGVARVTTDLITKCCEDCRKYLDDYIDAEAAIAKSGEPGFVERMAKATSLRHRKASLETESETGFDQLYESESNFSLSEESQKDEPLKNTQEQLAVVRGRIAVYFEEAKRGIKNHVPRAITHKLIYGVVDNLENALKSQLDTGDLWNGLMQESEMLINERQDTEKALERYMYAKYIIDQALACPQG